MRTSVAYSTTNTLPPISARCLAHYVYQLFSRSSCCRMKFAGATGHRSPAQRRGNFCIDPGHQANCRGMPPMFVACQSHSVFAHTLEHTVNTLEHKGNGQKLRAKLALERMRSWIFALTVVARIRQNSSQSCALLLLTSWRREPRLPGSGTGSAGNGDAVASDRGWHTHAHTYSVNHSPTHHTHRLAADRTTRAHKHGDTRETDAHAERHRRPGTDKQPNAFTHTACQTHAETCSQTDRYISNHAQMHSDSHRHQQTHQKTQSRTLTQTSRHTHTQSHTRTHRHTHTHTQRHTHTHTQQ